MGFSDLEVTDVTLERLPCAEARLQAVGCEERTGHQKMKAVRLQLC